MLNDLELTTFRHTYYSLFVQLWWKEPEAEFIAALMSDIEARIEAAAAVYPLMGEGWRAIQQHLETHPPEDVAGEFTELFVGPHGPAVQPYESYYLTGHVFREPLVNFRAFLQQLGLEKEDETFAEPEDVLAFELEVMRWLVDKQMAAVGTEAEADWLQRQVACLKHHVLVWGPACTQDIERAEGAGFYRGAAMILRGFLEFEREMLWDWEIEPVATLEEARRVYRRDVFWQGPSFESEFGVMPEPEGRGET